MKPFLLILLISLVSCGTRTEQVEYVSPVKQTAPVHIVNTLAFKRYALSDSEHVFIIDVDDKYVQRCCMVFIDDTTKTSHMNCNFDDAGGALPEDNAE